MLEIRNFSKCFDDRLILSDFSFTALKGSFTVLIGPSGCGKSTLFELLMGVLSRDGGTLLLEGEKIADLRTRAAYMAQKDLLLPWMTLRENALLPVTVKRRPSSGDAKETDELFALLGLSGFENHYPSQISGGMAQRCALARTLMFRTPVALLDEPLSAVDAITRQSLRNLLLLLQSRFDKTILMVTHDVEDALLLADRILLLSSAPLTIVESITLSDEKPRDGAAPYLLEMKKRILAVLQEERQ